MIRPASLLTAVALVACSSGNGGSPLDGGSVSDASRVVTADAPRDPDEGSGEAGNTGGDGGAQPPGTQATPVDAGLPTDASTKGMRAGINVHDYPLPSAYGFDAAGGGDRMGAGLVALGAPPVRGAALGDTTFLARLASFGVKEVVLLLSASAEGKPFDPAAVGPLLQKSVDAAAPLGLTLQVEGLNEWDLFNSKSYNAGVVPSGMTASGFVLYTQKALYEAAHPLGLTVLGPSVGHPDDPKSLAFFPDVSPYVDVVNAHVYFTANPEGLSIPTYVTDHQRFEGTGKPLWVTETGISSYGTVSADVQADVIRRGLGVFEASALIARAYVYELLDDQMPGLSGSTYTPDSAEYHFGLFTFAGTAKPAAASFENFAGAP